MKSRFSPVTFAVIFCCVYAAAYWFNQPAFLYYPLHGNFTWGPVVMKKVGPGMVWYGLMADALVCAFVLSLIIPNRVFDKIFRNYLWLFPCAAMLTCAYLLRNFFLQG